MAEIKFTPGQLQAINDEGKNILVAVIFLDHAQTKCIDRTDIGNIEFCQLL